jgi:hypothetical protein
MTHTFIARAFTPALPALLALAATALPGCAAPAPVEEPGIQLQMITTIPPRTEVEHCKFVTVPDAWVTRDEVAFSSGSHHVLLYQTAYEAIPTRKEDGTPIDTSGVFDCSDGATNGWRITKLIGGSQNALGDSLLAFPEGVALQIGKIAMINAHYINSSDEPISPRITIKLHTLRAEDVEEEGDILFLYNPLIGVRGGSTARAEWRCPVYRDITIANIQSHMHARGVGYAASVDGQPPFYVNDQWSNVPVQHYENFVVRAGEHLRYHCDYRNAEARTIYQGPRTTDEMCMLIGSYYPADARTASCLDATGKLPGGDWIGQGTASCAQTLGCVQSADGLEAITDCMLASDPSVSHPTSELLRCVFGAQDPAADCQSQIETCIGQ